MKYRIYFSDHRSISPMEVEAHDLTIKSHRKVSAIVDQGETSVVIDFGLTIRCIADDQNRTVYDAGAMEQLHHLFKGVVWDGNLISKSDIAKLREAELAACINGWNFITAKGILMLETLGLIRV